jgi:hypothetical protein
MNVLAETVHIARFENKNILFEFEKRSSLLERWRCTKLFINSKVVGSTRVDSSVQKTVITAKIPTKLTAVINV